MKELSITAASYLLLGLLGATGVILSLVSMRKKNARGRPARGIFWVLLGIIGLGAIVLFADYLETLRALETISNRVEVMIRGL
jgi:multisubunit Na+/H+ antiporter MnhB subunit